MGPPRMRAPTSWPLIMRPQIRSSRWGTLTPRSILPNHSPQVRLWSSTPYLREPNTFFDITNRKLRQAKLPHPLAYVLDIPFWLRIEIAKGQPVVALETTIYTHGLPYPDNLEVALELEKICRENGAIPATIGIVDSCAVVGLDKAQLQKLCELAGNPEVMKVSRRDLPYILGSRHASAPPLNGGTTVSGTMVLAHAAGIRVFGSGGLGGVHRGGQDTMDISADLTELGRTPVAVVTSGSKSFLDIPRTLEYLETQGVCVSTYNPDKVADLPFPAFYTRDSGSRSPTTFWRPKDAAAMINASYCLGLDSGFLFANPIPEEFAMPKAEIDLAINQAIREADEQGIRGHASTPFILAKIKDLTKGSSLPANKALVRSNVALAARIAVQLSELTKNYPKNAFLPPVGSTLAVDSSKDEPEYGSFVRLPLDKPEVVEDDGFVQDAQILVLGSVAMDTSCDHSPRFLQIEGNSAEPTKALQMHSSNPASIRSSIGGVGHNVALAAHRASALSTVVRLGSIIGPDSAGKAILSRMEEEQIDTHGIITSSDPNEKTAQYISVNDSSKELVVAMADMKLFSSAKIPPSALMDLITKRLKWGVVDANWNPECALTLMNEMKSVGANVIFEPVSVPKSSSIFELSPSFPKALSIFPNHIIDLATPNEAELCAIHAGAKRSEYFESARWWTIIDSLGIPSSGARDRFVQIAGKELTDNGIPFQTIQLLPYIPSILTKLGPQGVLLTELLRPDDSRLSDPAHAEFVLSRCMNLSEEVGGVYMRLFPAVRELGVGELVSVNGAGDTFLGVVVAGLVAGARLDRGLIDAAQEAAVLTLKSEKAVAEEVGDFKKRMYRLANQGRFMFE